MSCGGNTSIWHDPWVPGLPQCRVKHRVRGDVEDEPQKVSELVSTGSWKVETLNRLFSPVESNTIQSIPLSRSIINDAWMWYHNSNGKFTVRSAYFIELNSDRRPL